MAPNKRIGTARKLSLVAGILILIHGAMVSDFSTVVGGNPKDFYLLSVIGVACGVIILLSAIMVARDPSHNKVWGVIIIALSIVGIMGGGGFLIGSLLGIIGGALAYTWRGTR